MVAGPIRHRTRRSPLPPQESIFDLSGVRQKGAAATQIPEQFPVVPKGQLASKVVLEESMGFALPVRHRRRGSAKPAPVLPQPIRSYLENSEFDHTSAFPALEIHRKNGFETSLTRLLPEKTWGVPVRQRGNLTGGVEKKEDIPYS